MATDTFGPRYSSLFLMLFVFAQNAILYAWVVSAIPRPPAKRAVVLAFMNCVGNLASVWTPFTYRTQDAPHYRLSLGICIGLELTALICAITLRWYLMNQNAELERLESAGYEPSGKELKRLEKMAEIQGIDIAEARKLQRGYRYTL